ncbi:MULTISPECIES: protein-export chaperone SecB [Paracoccus]|jgi:preprotein translocase subunit SecB|uniref:Protein-export protein SecB n=1 Tax=Paracoccus litorisediminis TaxID=2006130 RepID=A0A844HLX0_9RHOB|nr:MULTISPECIES: protein-export chaperone SecB [Paracoccus]MBD9528111.1 protein-export chaperone SecB [Paracoccus sp. PAR01]MTH59185.1 protein-export chaperone SecB [Paracoccus litorisediminis]
MSDETTNGAAAPAGTQPAVRMQILTQYIRDLSFENAVAQKGLPSGEVQPEISVQVSLDARKRTTEHQYEVISKFRVQSVNAADKSPIFLCELDYGGIFHVEGVPEEQLHPFLMIECPRMLFPFVRRIISDMTRDGGFPTFNMDPVDFVALYRQEISRRVQAERPADQPLS